jgi:excisionase family DNA binding protein
MAQKFLSLEEAADQLGISKDRLNELRQANKVTGYKDGASWKFRPEAIEKLASEGIPDIDPPPSDLSLDLDDAYEMSPETTPPPAKAEKAPTAKADVDESDLQLADEDDEPAPTPKTPQAEPVAAAGPDSDLNLDNEELVAGPASDLSLEEVDEPTVAGIDEEGSDDALALDAGDSIDINTDSILLSEAELGESPPRPPSTIIGKAELDMDADLDLSPLDKGATASDVKLADSDLLPGSGMEDIGLDLSDPSGDFSGLEELEVDLEAESSRIMSPEDVEKAKLAAKAAASKKKPAASSGLSDLDLAPSSSIATSDIGLGKEEGSGTGLTGLSALELDDDDDDAVLGEGSDGSDVTLSGESSGINIISPSDSGLALDEVPLDLSGSAPIGSSLDLGSSVGLEESGIDQMSISGIGTSKAGDFQLTPLGEEDADEEKDSSQVIALDELSEEGGGPALEAGLGDAGMMAEDFGVGLAPGAMPVGVPAGAETPFSIWNVLALAGCIIFVSLCGMMTYDLVRNIWSWDGVTTLNSSLLQVLNPFLGR